MEKIRGQVYHCTRCAGCLPPCPTYAATGEEALSARGRLVLVEAVLEGKLGLTPGLERRLYECLLCGACAAACPSGVDVPEVILAMRAEVARPGNRRLTRAAARGLAGAGDGFFFHVMRNPSVRRRLLGIGARARSHVFPRLSPRSLEDVIPKTTRIKNASRRVALFPGCATSLFFQQTAEAAVRVLGRGGIEVTFPRGLACCGLPLRSLGDAAAAVALTRHNLELLARTGADAAVTVCSSCAAALGKAVVETPSAPPVMDIHALLAETGAADRVAPDRAKRPPERFRSGPGRERVTWHDPCHLGRDLGITQEPREIIAALPGVEYVEAGRLKCCGGGGLFSLWHYDLALKIGLPRAEELAATGARLVATGCPGCRIQLQDMLGRLDPGIRVVHPVELLDGRFDARPHPG